jgi:hypothetical protein
MKYHPDGHITWKRPPWRYLILYLDAVTAPILSVIIALAIIGLKSLLVH